jgi:hypothetical protein
MVRGQYGWPVYLVGSALRDDNPDPRDWDVRVMLSDRWFRTRFGDPGLWEREGSTGNWTKEIRWRWSDACVKQAKHGSLHTRLNIDFQAYPLEYAHRFYGGQPRMRLDTRE